METLRTVRQAPGREAIRASAIALFAEKGFAAASTREICERAGVTKPVLYHHFKSKDGLYRRLLEDACEESRRELGAAARRANTARETLVDVFTADFALTRRNPALSLLFFRMLFAPRKEEPAIDYVEMGMEWLRLVAGIVQEGVRRGEMKGRPMEIAEAFLGIHMIYTMSYLLTGKPALGRPLARRIVNLVLEGCGK
jgi:TetR/AcrR family transcriptional regulator